ncbi:unnamed protein product [Arctia plantaginis]|uniref:Uncharacterized protein n=1 Tax=Arctia plantaginis TaxID=874455 RepID=A0A8S1A4Y7_ARCPL|nr:unnamed protein product [Arctia plantaginis]CAB3241398.1 unnamed protein product [Arctia plantaginis]
MKEKKSPLKYFICGGIGGLLGVSLGYPMDTIKVRLQTMPVPKPGEETIYTGMIDCARKTIKMDGVKGLFRGILAPLAVAAPVNAVNFFGFGIAKKLIEKDSDHIHSMSELFAAGTFAGLVTSVLVGPSEHIKCLLQLHDDNSSNPKYSGAVDCCKKLYAEGGIKNVFKGTGATILRDIPAAGTFFMSYETLKEILVPENASGAYDMLATIFSGGCAGCLYWLVGMPADVLKTRYQTAPPGKYKNVRDVFRKLMATEGPSGLYHGLAPVLVRAFPVNALTFVGFEIGLKVCNWVIPDL